MRARSRGGYGRACAAPPRHGRGRVGRAFRPVSGACHDTASMRRTVLASLASVLAVALAGCGGTSDTATTPATTQATTAPSVAPTTNGAGGPGALQAEANAAAAGDIPDNQVFLVFDNARAGYSMKFPEGWAQYGSGKAVVFRDKNNIVRIDVGSG